MWYKFIYNNSFLHFTLKESCELLGQSKGILPFKTGNRFESTLRPTFLLYLRATCFKQVLLLPGLVCSWLFGSVQRSLQIELAGQSFKIE